MKVKDILKVTEDEVIVMDEAMLFAPIAKYTDNEESIAINYDRNAVLNMTVKGIQISDSSLILTVNSLEEVAE